MTTNEIIVQCEKVDNAFVRVTSNNDGALEEASEFFTFTPPGAKYAKFHRKGWDGKIRLMTRGGNLPYGLVPYLKLFCESNGYTFVNKINMKTAKVTQDHVRDMATKYKIPFELHQHQVDAIQHLLSHRRAVAVSPTASGKSLVAYIIARLFDDILAKDKKILIIVPTTGLVDQLRKDFAGYGTNDDSFDVASNVHAIHAGQEKITDKRIIISTWQSIYKLHKSWFDQFGCVIGDECHLFRAKNLTGIMNKLVKCPFRFGMTGSLDGTNIHQLQLEGVFGPSKEIVSVLSLIEQNKVSKARIVTLRLLWPHKNRMEVPAKYQKEIEYIVSSEPRRRFVANHVGTLKGNTLILFNFLDMHGKPLFEDLKKAYGEYRCFYVDGSVSASERSDIRAKAEESDNAIIVASYGTFSTGINIKKLHNLVFASPFKGDIRGKQSIGRVLRLCVDKYEAVVYDVVDEMQVTTPNYAMKHFAHRLNLYQREGYPVSFVECLWDDIENTWKPKIIKESI